MMKEMMKTILSRKMMRYTIPIVVIGIAMLSIQLSLIQGAEEAEETSLFEENKSLAFIGAGLAVGFAGIGSGIAIYGATSAGAAAIVEKPESFVYILIFAGLGEGLAIYGLVVAIMILGKI